MRKERGGSKRLTKATGKVSKAPAASGSRSSAKSKEKVSELALSDHYSIKLITSQVSKRLTPSVCKTVKESKPISISSSPSGSTAKKPLPINNAALPPLGDLYLDGDEHMDSIARAQAETVLRHAPIIQSAIENVKDAIAALEIHMSNFEIDTFNAMYAAVQSGAI